MKNNTSGSHNLTRVYFRKEILWWKRTWGMTKKVGYIGFFIAILFLMAGHYAFAIMHFLMEGALYLFNRPQFEANLTKLNAQVA